MGEQLDTGEGALERTIRLILEAAKAEGKGEFVRSAKVVRRALKADRKLTVAAKRWLGESTGSKAAGAERFYDVLVRLTCSARRCMTRC